MTSRAEHRGGDRPPLVLLHGFTADRRTWDLVVPVLRRSFDVLAVTLPGHAGGPPLPDVLHDDVLVEAVEAELDRAGWAEAHVAGNSLGGHVALQLAARGRARSVTALAPAGGWAAGDLSYRDVLAHFAELRPQVLAAAPHADALMATPEGRRMATLDIAVRFEHLPAGLLAHQLRAAAGCTGFDALVAHALEHGWAVDLDAVRCPVRVVWGTEDRLLAWPRTAARFREALWHADWVVLDDVGHCPQLDVPDVCADLIAGGARLAA